MILRITAFPRVSAFCQGSITRSYHETEGMPLKSFSYRSETHT